MSKNFSPEIVYLSNGIPVVLQNYEGLVASAYWWVRTGSADEGRDEEGFAHFLEHMLFKDAAAKETGAPSSGKMAREIESLGGDINAYTSFDQTVYHVTCAEQHWEKVLGVFAQMPQPKKFLKTDFLREREVILEELKKNEDSPNRQLFQTLFSATYASHPYGRPVIGYSKTLKAARVQDLERFYRRQYISGNMGLVLVGPLGNSKSPRKKSILKILEKQYGSSRFPKKPGFRPSRRLEKELRKSSKIVGRSFDVQSPSAMFAFRIPSLQHEDTPALDLLSSVLGFGELSRLYQKLFYEKSIVTDIGSGVYVPKDPGVFYLDFEFDEVSKFEEVCSEAFAELKRIEKEGPTPEEFERVFKRAESEKLYSTQSVDEVAARLGFLNFMIEDPAFDHKYLESLKALKPADLARVAQKYFDDKRLDGALLFPKKEEKPDLAAIENLAKKNFARTSESKKTKSLPKKLQRVEKWKTSSGIQVVYSHRPHSPVFSVQAFVLGGLRLEIAAPVSSADADWGSSHLLALTWTKGTADRSSQEISKIVEGNAASLDGFNGRNSVGLSLTGLSRDWSRLSELFGEVLVAPDFPEPEVEHSRRVAEETVRGIDDHTAQLCNKHFLETLFENHPYGRLTSGSLQSLAGIDRSRLLAFHRDWVRADRLVLSVSGNISRSELESWLDSIEKAFSERNGKSDRDLPLSLPDEPLLKAPRWVERELNRGQSHIMRGGLGTKISSGERFALRLAHTILGGQSGRLFIELREKKSLAYSVAPLSFEGLERGYIGTYIACSPEKRDEALKGIQTVYERLAQKGPSESEMKRAKEFYLGRRAMELQGDTSIAEYHGLQRLYGIETDWDEIKAKVTGVSKKQVQSFCKNYLVDPPMVTSIVG